MLALLVEIGTPAQPPKPRGKSLVKLARVSENHIFAYFDGGAGWARLEVSG